MTQRELEKLLKNPEVLRELEQGLFGDPALWASPAELQAAQSAEEFLARKRLQIKEQVMRRMTETGEERRAIPPRRTGKRALQWSVAAACVAVLACYIAFYPQNKSLATSYDEKVLRKAEGCVIIESVEEAQPDGQNYSGMRVSGADGFEMYSYSSIDEYIEKTGREPVLLTGGYEKIVSIFGELDPNRGYTLMVDYELPGERYISTSQFYAEDAKEMIFPDGYERTVLGGKTMHCRVEDDSTSVWGSVRLSKDCIFFISMPYEEQFDPYLDRLAFASTLDTSLFVVAPIETSPQPDSAGDPEWGPKEAHYDTFADYSRDTGYWPVVLHEAYAKPVSIKFFTTIATKTLSVIYEKDGHEIYAFQDYRSMGGGAYMMEDQTYFTTEILGGYTMHCSVDLHDGSSAGVALVKDTPFFIIAEKGIDFEEMLTNLRMTTPH